MIPELEPRPATCQCSVQIPANDERASLWLRLRGSLSWPLLDPRPRHVSNGIFLLGRIHDLSAEQLAVLLEFVVRKRGGSVQDAREDLGELGAIPIVAAGLSIHVCARHTIQSPPDRFDMRLVV
jgi:hypothetical protein